ncbi:hypothetical protein [Methylomonas rivi]|uniref:Uncharacterized protein n=1 Tax=Methylomonas rivi TaxID=2952226 RepID=A0ABT1U4S3_9GAMM|nr:hypothetical protein [Methylomonas sp. WSC-6]MCQ8128851.1 hypothetical protein [Methylomonas sp. WSC-6]
MSLGMLMRVVCILYVVALGMEGALADPSSPNQNDEPGSGGLTAKRLGPSEIDPVVIGNVRYEVIHWGKERGLRQNGGYIAAFDTANNKELWLLKVYDVAYDPDLESDVQDVFIVSMSKGFFSGKLHIKDEKGRNFIVDPDTRGIEQE